MVNDENSVVVGVEVEQIVVMVVLRFVLSSSFCHNKDDEDEALYRLS